MDEGRTAGTPHKHVLRDGKRLKHLEIRKKKENKIPLGYSNL